MSPAVQSLEKRRCGTGPGNAIRAACRPTSLERMVDSLLATLAEVT
jgi:hypothetical protein